MRHATRFILAIVLAVEIPAGASIRPVESLPANFSNTEFWNMVTDFSEAGGKFTSQIMSNELGAQFVIPELKHLTKPGGAFVGVGAEQNFTYIAALEPKVAFIVDIRRQNMIEHLIYKSIFEMSDNRREFISLLFSREVPDGLTEESSAEILFRAYSAGHGDTQLFSQNLQKIKRNLTKDHGFPLTVQDQSDIGTIYKELFDAGPMIWQPGKHLATYYGSLMVDTDKSGQAWSYLATENNFRFVREMQRRNLIIPLVGDFSGLKTLHAIGQFLGDRNTVVSTFYISNVEDYLFTKDGLDSWRQFYRNTADLPLDETSTFIRTEGSSSDETANRPPGTRFVTYISSMKEVIQAFSDGRIENHAQVLEMSKR